MLFKKTDFEKKLEQLKNNIGKSFWRVRQDTNLIFQWLDYLNKKLSYQESYIQQLESQLKLMPTKDEIKSIIDRYYSFEGIQNRIIQLNSRVDEIRNLYKELLTRLEERAYKTSDRKLFEEVELIKRRLENLEKKPSLKERIIKQITRNSKEYLKNMILSTIQKYGEISALRLKEMIVEEQGLCSKSSFYRLLSEIEEEAEVISVIKKGKEKHYIYKPIKIQY